MFRKTHFSLFIAAALFLTGTLFAFAQSSPVRGRVELKKADGTTEPVAGAVIEVYRTDIKGKLPTGKTDKKGAFQFAGFPLGQTFALAVSAPNVTPSVYPNIKGGMENITITVVPGDGKHLTEDEARQLLAAPAKASASGTSSVAAAANSAKPAQSNAEQKKALEEQAKAQAEYEGKKKNADDTFAVVKKSFDEGSKAFAEKNYDLAISKYDEGITAEPNFEGSTPALLNNKSLALLKRGTDKYNQTIKADAPTKIAALESAKKDFQTVVDSSNRALEILGKAPASSDAANQKKLATNKSDAMKNRNEAYRLMGKTGADRSKGKETFAAYQEYMAVETDAAAKSAAQLSLAQTLQDANEFEMAIVEFGKVLDADANNVDALSGIGFSLVNVGYINNDKEKLQQGANYLQKFADLAPDTNQYKADAKGLIESLKKEQNVAPQKITKTPAKKKP